MGRTLTFRSAAEIQQLELESKEDEVRLERNKRISDTDWMMLSDAPTNKTAVEEYRQLLRDVPQQPGFPLDVVWPELGEYRINE